ncbi:PH domain-containing protein [Nitratireductor mangrovi]|uniref:PH domain-containing protein n=1 Tax=Nitratireductor mangrovi TaxID=2599600 RepID=A0A5B8L2G9_9HYPH|nr:PH domain-containing protein [Nitratireductor mangrovi]QDZ01989.1 PH domain-containing protein [Nitratireductor mangrovi]
MHGVNDNPEPRHGGPFVPSTLSLFLPTIVVVVGYGLLLSFLFAAGRGDGALARLCIVVLAIGGPFLIAHAVLRRFTISVAVMPRALYLHRGFPHSQPFEIPYALIDRVSVRRGLPGRIAGSGALVVTLANGRRVVVGDLAQPHAAARAICAHLPEPRVRDLGEAGDGTPDNLPQAAAR